MKLNYKLVLTGVLASAFLVACGGGGGGGGGGASISNSTSALFNYVNGLIASSTDETSEPVDINGLTLAMDDSEDPRPVN